MNHTRSSWAHVLCAYDILHALKNVAGKCGFQHVTVILESNYSFLYFKKGLLHLVYLGLVT